MLGMKVPVAVGNGLDVQQAIGAGLLLAIGHAREQTFTLDAAVNDGVGDVQALRAELARQRLHQ